jgi:small subunit ribosomal protein S20
MPNTKSAERRMRSSVRKNAHNNTIKSRVKTLEKNYAGLAASGKKEEASEAYRKTASAFDQAVKKGVIHPRAASRKKSRLAHRLNKIA